MKQLGVGIGCDDGADIAPVEHGTARLMREAALAVEQGGPHQWMRRDDRGIFADLVAAQFGILEQMIVEIAGGDGIGLDRRVEFQPHHIGRDRAIKQPGVEMRQPVPLGERAGDGALARCGGPVDGDDHEPATTSVPFNASSVSRNIG